MNVSHGDLTGQDFPEGVMHEFANETTFDRIQEVGITPGTWAIFRKIVRYGFAYEGSGEPMFGRFTNGNAHR